MSLWGQALTGGNFVDVRMRKVMEIYFESVNPLNTILMFQTDFCLSELVIFAFNLTNQTQKETLPVHFPQMLSGASHSPSSWFFDHNTILSIKYSSPSISYLTAFRSDTIHCSPNMVTMFLCSEVT